MYECVDFCIFTHLGNAQLYLRLSVSDFNFMAESLICSALHLAASSGNLSTIGFAAATGFAYKSVSGSFVTLKYAASFIFYSAWNNQGMWSVTGPVSPSTSTTLPSFDGTTIKFKCSTAGSGIFIIAIFPQPVDITNIIASQGDYV